MIFSGPLESHFQAQFSPVPLGIMPFNDGSRPSPLLKGMDVTTNDGPLRLSEAAKAVGVTTAWLKAEARHGRIPCLKVGHRYFFNLQAVRTVLNQRAATSFVSAPIQPQLCAPI